MKEITLRPLREEDVTLLTTWLNKDYILKWYHEPEEWLKEIHEREGEYSWIHHFMVMVDNTPIGFCQYYDCYDAKDLEDWYTVTKRKDTFSMDYLIGNEAYLGKGYGKAIVKELTDTIREKEKAKQIIVKPEKENMPSNHVLMANGYLFDKEKDYYYKQLD